MITKEELLELLQSKETYRVEKTVSTTNKDKFLLLSATGSKKSRTHAKVVPVKINGILFPIGVSTLSEMEPKSGNKNKAKILSAAIMVPVNVSPIPKLFFKIKGIILSYICQKEQIDIKARPISMVLL